MMNPTVLILPPKYREVGRLDLAKSKVAFVLLNVGSVLLMVISGGLIIQFLAWARPEGWGEVMRDGVLMVEPNGSVSFRFSLNWMIAALGVTLMVVIIHELVHGIAIWFYTRTLPTFGYKILYAYTALPEGVYLLRNPYLVVVLAPLVGLTVLGVLAMVLVPSVLIPGLLLFVIFNIAGAVGDLWVAGWLLHYPSSALTHDTGSVTTVFSDSAV